MESRNGGESRRILYQLIQHPHRDFAAGVGDGLPALPATIQLAVGGKVDARKVIGARLGQLFGDLGGDAAATGPELIRIVIVDGDDHRGGFGCAEAIGKRGKVQIVASGVPDQAQPRHDGFETVSSWGRNGVELFYEVYAQQSAYVVMFISDTYVSKFWPIHERKSALSRMILEQREYILPVRFDGTEVPGLPGDIIYLCARERTPAQLSAEIADKLGIRPFAGKASEVPAPKNDIAGW